MRSCLIVATIVLACGGSGELVSVRIPPQQQPPYACSHATAGGVEARTTCLTLPWHREVDVLFVIDDGANAGALQSRLADAMPEFAARIEAMDPPPDLRIAFTSSRDGNSTCAPLEGGAGRLTLSSCRERPTTFIDADGNYRFEELCAPRCDLHALTTRATTIEGDDTERSRPWIELGPTHTNLPDDVAPADALQCASLLGIAGCPFAAPLRATWYAVQRSYQDGDQPEVGFLRSSAMPVIVWVTSGIECSLGDAGEDSFDPEGSRALWTDPEAATAGLCWRAGVACSSPDADGLMDCTARDVDGAGAPSRGGAAVLERLDVLAELLELIEATRGSGIGRGPLPVVAITGSSDDPAYPARVRAADDAHTRARYGVAPSCALDGDPLFPPVRLAAFAETDAEHAYGIVSTELVSACTDDFGPALDLVADRIAELVIPTCVPTCVADVDADARGLQVDCTLRAELATADGLDEVEVGPCGHDASGRPVVPPGESGCFVARTGDALRPACAAKGYNLELDIEWSGSLPSSAVFFPDCELSDDRDRDCPRL